MSWSDRYRYLRSRGSDLGGREYHSMILEKLTMMTTGDWVKRPKVLPVMRQKLFFIPKFYQILFLRISLLILLIQSFQFCNLSRQKRH